MASTPLPAAAICGTLVPPEIASPLSDDARAGAVNVAPPSLEIEAYTWLPWRRSSQAIATTSSAVPAARGSIASAGVNDDDTALVVPSISRGALHVWPALLDRANRMSEPLLVPVATFCQTRYAVVSLTWSTGKSASAAASVSIATSVTAPVALAAHAA